MADRTDAPFEERLRGELMNATRTHTWAGDDEGHNCERCGPEGMNRCNPAAHPPSDRALKRVFRLLRAEWRPDRDRGLWISDGALNSVGAEGERLTAVDVVALDALLAQAGGGGGA